MGIETDNFGYPKPGEDDFYDIGVFNQAMDMVDKDLKDLGDKKQDKLGIGTFTGNIDVLGAGGLPQTSSICLCQSNKIEGVLPYESENEYWFTLKTSHAAENSPGAARTQKAIVHSADGIRVFGRMSMDGAWGGWREYLFTDGDLKDATCTFESDDEVLVKMGVPTIGGESQLEGYSTANGGRKWHTMPPLSIKDKFSEAIKKVTTLFHNVRYLYEVLGSSDISNLADGTVTGALSKLNTDLGGIVSVATYLNKEEVIVPKHSYAHISNVDLSAYVREGYRAVSVSSFLMTVPGVFYSRVHVEDNTLWCMVQNINGYDVTLVPNEVSIRMLCVKGQFL